MSEEAYQNYIAEVKQNPEAAGLRAALQLKDIEIARANLEGARHLNNYVSLLMEKWERKLKEAEAISRGQVN
jgi:hypothetical protein